MYASAEPTLTLDLLLGSQRADLRALVAPWSPAQVVPFESGKSALWGALRATRLAPGNEILVPAYVYHSVLDPMRALALTCRYYRVTSALEADLDDLTAKIGARTRAVLLVHYFGFPGPARALRRLCDERGLVLIEDCAHALFSRDGDCPLGSIGDASAFSLKKPLSVPGGGFLVVNNPALRFDDRLVQPRATEGISRLVARILGSVEAAVGWSIKAQLLSSHDFRRLLARRSRRRQSRFDRGLSIISAAMARRVDPSAVVRRRQANYRRLLDELADLPWLRPVFPGLAAGVSPFCFPVYLEERDRIQDYLLGHGIHARVYWDVAEIPPGALDQCPETSSILDRILILPIHQSLVAEHVDEISRALHAARPVLAMA